VILRLVLLLVSLGFCACTFVGPDGTEFLTGVDVVTRDEAKASLRQAIDLNVAICPGNTVAGFYAREYTVPAFLNESYYRADRMADCTLAVILTPCELTPNANQDILLNLYQAVITACAPRKVGL
jgi:hypothetical protein